MKDLLRQKLKAIRQDIMDRQSKEDAIFRRLFLLLKEFDVDKTIFIYQSFDSEVETRRIINELKKLNYKILIPKVDNNFIMSAVDLVTGEIFIKTPSITITPLLGFNKDLHRIGFGKGCYDNYFKNHSHTIKIGIAFDEQLCNFSPQSHDVVLDYILTPMLEYCGADNCRQI
ncbi:MAG: 5-formyltetrahydrofolate cyclo-ligase [Firmicutes bacterium]|nr:5-formyltetrahydrofolate cyclo-ligase [Bacillota bacterium]